MKRPDELRVSHLVVMNPILWVLCRSFSVSFGSLEMCIVSAFAVHDHMTDHQEVSGTARSDQAPHFPRCLIDLFYYDHTDTVKILFLPAIVRRIAVVEVVFPRIISTLPMLHSFP